MYGVQRSPIKALGLGKEGGSSPGTSQKDPNADLLKSIDVLMGTHTAKINQNVDEKIDGLRKTVEIRFGVIEDKLKKVEKENQELKKKNSELEERVISLEKGPVGGDSSERLLYLERSVRQRNIVATGIEFETPQQGYEKLNQMIGAVTQGEIKVSGLRAFKQKSGKGMIVAECGSMEDKQCIMRAKKQFVMTVGEESHPIYVDSDLPPQDRARQGWLRAKARELRAQGKDVRISQGRLKVDGEWLNYNTVNHDPENHSFRKQD